MTLAHQGAIATSGGFYTKQNLKIAPLVMATFLRLHTMTYRTLDRTLINDFEGFARQLMPTIHWRQGDRAILWRGGQD